MHIPVDWGNHSWRMLIFVWRFHRITITYKTTDECDELNCTVQNRRALVLPSSERTQQIPRHSWRWFSNSQGGICEFPGGYIILPHDFNFNICFFPAIMGGDVHLIPLVPSQKLPPPPPRKLEPRKIDGLGRCCFHFPRGRPNRQAKRRAEAETATESNEVQLKAGKKWGSSGTCLTCPTVQIYPVHPRSLTYHLKNGGWKTTFRLSPGKFSGANC